MSIDKIDVKAHITSNNFSISFVYRSNNLFFEGLFIVILSLSLTEFDLLVILLISTIFLEDIIRNVFLR